MNDMEYRGLYNGTRTEPTQDHTSYQVPPAFFKHFNFCFVPLVPTLYPSLRPTALTLSG